MTTALFIEPTYELAERLSERALSVFLYRFGRISPKARATKMLAAHTFEIPYVFGSLSNDGDYDPTDHRLAEEMRAAWVAFATTGTPECEAVRWPAFRRTDPRVAYLNDTVTDAAFEPPPLFECFRRLRHKSGRHS